MMLEHRALVRVGLICAALVTMPSANADTLGAVQISGPEDQAAVEGLAGAYTFGVAEAQLTGCVVRLEGAPSETKTLPGFPVTIGANCLRKFASLKDVSRWQPTGGGSLRLLGGEPLRELSDFSPVQDGSGVYIRGGFEGDNNVYELRTQGGTQ